MPGRQGQVGIGPHLPAADPPAQLVELRQAEHVGAVDDDRVDRWQIEPGLDDVGRQQHVVTALIEGANGAFEFTRRHAAVGGDDFDLGHQLGEDLRDVVQELNPRRDIEGLAAAIALAQDRLADNDGIEVGDERTDGQAIDRRGRDQAHLAHAGERQLQRPRDRCRGERQDVNVALQPLQTLLVSDAKVLLLIDDDEAEIAKGDVLGQERVGADDDVDGALTQPALGGFCLLRCDEPRELRHPHGQARETTGEGPVMLA